MIRFRGTKAASLIIAIGTASLTTSVLAFAGENVSSDTIVRALQPKPLTRGLMRRLRPRPLRRGISSKRFATEKHDHSRRVSVRKSQRSRLTNPISILK